MSYMKRYRETRKIFRCVAEVFFGMFIVLGVTACSDGSKEVIETVQNGYLGEYTDTTIVEALDGYYGTIYEGIEWRCRVTDNDETVVQVEYTSEHLEPTKIQFTLLDNDRFKVTAMVGPNKKVQKPSDVVALLNYIYYQQFMQENTELMGETLAEMVFLEVVSQMSGSSVLYGASSDYPEDRSQLYQFWDDIPLDGKVPILLDVYDYINLEKYTSESNSDSSVSEASENSELFNNSDKITFDTEFYTLTLPEYWADLCVYEPWDIGLYSYGITFYEEQSYDDFSGEGGMLFSIALYSNDEYYEFPDYTYLGELSVIRLANFDIVALFPTDVQFSDAGQDNYMRLQEDIDDILSSFEPQADLECEYSPASDSSSAMIEHHKTPAIVNADDPIYSYVGSWGDSVSQRCIMTIEAIDSNSCSIKINWGSSASEDTEWSMTGQYNPQTGFLEYADCMRYDNIWLEDGEPIESEVYWNGTGYFFLSDGYLYWQDDVEGIGENCRFEKFE